jgi:hypothetical protein
MSNLVMENNSMNDKKHPELAKSDIIKHLPKTCGDEKAAVEFFERQRWGNSPVCPHCQSAGWRNISTSKGWWIPLAQLRRTQKCSGKLPAVGSRAQR